MILHVWSCNNVPIPTMTLTVLLQFLSIMYYECANTEVLSSIGLAALSRAAISYIVVGTARAFVEIASYQ